MSAAAKLARLPIVAAGVLAASAVAALPFVAPLQTRDRGEPIPDQLAAPAARKGDRLRTIFAACDDATGGQAVCADIFGSAAGPSATVVIERRVGVSTSVLVRFQAPAIILRRP